MPEKNENYRFRIAFSFAGEKRKFVSEVAEILANKFGIEHILYDKYHEAEFSRSDLGIYLPDLYNNECELIVVVLCKNYNKKEWTGLEWLAIHDLLKKRKNNIIMLTRFDHAKVTGLYSNTGFIELDRKSPDETAILIFERLALNEGKPRNYYVDGSNSSNQFQNISYVLRAGGILTLIIIVLVFLVPLFGKLSWNPLSKKAVTISTKEQSVPLPSGNGKKPLQENKPVPFTTPSDPIPFYDIGITIVNHDKNIDMRFSSNLADRLRKKTGANINTFFPEESLKNGDYQKMFDGNIKDIKLNSLLQKYKYLILGKMEVSKDSSFVSENWLYIVRMDLNLKMVSILGEKINVERYFRSKDGGSTLGAAKDKAEEIMIRKILQKSDTILYESLLIKSAY